MGEQVDVDAVLLAAHREEFLSELERQGFTSEEAAECLRDFESGALTA